MKDKATLDKLIDNYRTSKTDGERAYVDSIFKQFMDEEPDVYRKSTFLLYYEKNKEIRELTPEEVDCKDINELDQTCAWKRVADEDLEMRAKGERTTPFFSSPACYDCNGYDVDCDKYLGFYLEKKGDEE